MLIKQTISGDRVAIYEAEKNSTKEIDGEIVAFAGERKKQSSPMDHCLNRVIQITYNLQSTWLVDVSSSQLFYIGSIKIQFSNQKYKIPSKDKSPVMFWILHWIHRDTDVMEHYSCHTLAFANPAQCMTTCRFLRMSKGSFISYLLSLLAPLLHRYWPFPLPLFYLYYIKRLSLK